MGRVHVPDVRWFHHAKGIQYVIHVIFEETNE